MDWTIVHVYSLAPGLCEFSCCLSLYAEGAKSVWTLCSTLPWSTILMLVYIYIYVCVCVCVCVCICSVQSLSCVQLFATPWSAGGQASLSITNSQSLLKLMSIESVMPSNLCHHNLCHPLLLPPSIFPSIRVFSNRSVLYIRWPKYWSFSISPSNEYSGLISFRIDWFDLLAVQGTLKSLLQYCSSKASILQCSAFFMVQLSQPYSVSPVRKLP